MNRALVRRPGPRLTEGLVTHIGRQPVDDAIAAVQWKRYVEALETAGWETFEVPPADDCPDAVFVEDTMVVFDDCVVLAAPCAPSRQPEVAAADQMARALGLEVLRLESPATFDGGDVLKVGRTAYVGCGARTNADAIGQINALLEPRGWTVVGIPITNVLHLKSALTALPDGTLIGWAPGLDAVPGIEGFLPMPEESGSHVVDLGNGSVLMADDCPLSHEIVRARGFVVVPVDISEFVKLEGCVTCLSIRIRGKDEVQR